MKLIPPDGAYRIVKSSGNNSKFSNAKDWFCSQDFLQYAQQNEASGGVSIPTEYGIASGNFDSSNSQQMQQRSSFCSDSSKTFSESASEFLFVKEGDPTLVKGFTDCIAQQRRQYLKASGAQLSTNVFSVSVGAVPYPGPEPRLISVTTVDGAIPVPGSTFTPSAKIPFDSPLMAMYKFDTNSQDALLLVDTTIGQATVKVTKCRKTNAGTWQVVSKAELTREVSAGTYSITHPFPQASCHPHCGDGDVLRTDMAVGSDLAIRNPKWACSGAGCVFDVDQRFSLDNEQHITFIVRVRSAPDIYTLSADQFRHEKYTQDQLNSQGSLMFGNTTAITVPDGAELRIDAVWGTATLTSAMLKSGNLGVTGRWLKSTGVPQIGNGGTVYSFDVVDANCTEE